MRIRHFEEIKKRVLECFARDFPGEHVHLCVFSTYILDMYCRMVENYDLYKHAMKKDVDL